MRTISTEELRKKIDDKEDFVLVDVLGTESFKSKHIPTSKDIGVNKIEERAPKELPDKGKEVVVYCASTECQASPTAAKKLEELGYTKVIDFESGLAGWQDAGYEFESS